MYCTIRENFKTVTTTVDDIKHGKLTDDKAVASQGDKNIMLTDEKGNISLVKFSDTVIRLQQKIDRLADFDDRLNALNEMVTKLQSGLTTPITPVSIPETTQEIAVS